MKPILQKNESKFLMNLKPLFPKTDIQQFLQTKNLRNCKLEQKKKILQKSFRTAEKEIISTMTI